MCSHSHANLSSPSRSVVSARKTHAHEMGFNGGYGGSVSAGGKSSHSTRARTHEIYAWIGCNSAKFGHLYAAAPTRPNNTVSVASLLKGNADSTGSSMALRLVLKTGLTVVLACNIPKDCPSLEAAAERKLIEKLRSLGYIRTGTAP